MTSHCVHNFELEIGARIAANGSGEKPEVNKYTMKLRSLHNCK
jgi:hypothetical protein